MKPLHWEKRAHWPSYLLTQEKYIKGAYIMLGVGIGNKLLEGWMEPPGKLIADPYFARQASAEVKFRDQVAWGTITNWESKIFLVVLQYSPHQLFPNSKLMQHKLEL